MEILRRELRHRARDPDGVSLLYNKRFHAGILLLNAIGEIVRPVLEQHNETKS
jgi:hypothetical protein